MEKLRISGGWVLRLYFIRSPVGGLQLQAATWLGAAELAGPLPRGDCAIVQEGGVPPSWSGGGVRVRLGRVFVVAKGGRGRGPPVQEGPPVRGGPDQPRRAPGALPKKGQFFSFWWFAPKKICSLTKFC